MTETLHNVTEACQPSGWKRIKPETQAALLEWYNVRAEDISISDLEALTDLQSAGRFKWWHCPACHELVMEGNPEHWGDFQGVCQNDRASYPGSGPRDRRCDHCRCYDKR